MFFALDSLKFYKLKSEGVARSLFMILYLLFLAFFTFPIGEMPDFLSILQQAQSGDISELSNLSSANILYLISSLVFTILTSLFSIIYATAFVMENEGFPGRKGIVDTLRKTPALAGLVLMLAVPAVISSLFLFIPLIFMYYSLFMSPLLITEGKKGIIDSITESYKFTRGYKLSIFFAQMMTYFIVNIPMSLFEAGFIYSRLSGTLPEHLVLSFIHAARILIMGRLMGNLYMFIVKNKKDVLRPVIKFTQNEDEDNSEDDNEEDEEN